MTNPNAIEQRAVGEFRVAADGRTLTGLIVPYNVVSMMTPYAGGERFLPKSFSRTIGRFKQGKKVHLFRAHDHTRAIGTAVDLRETDDGVEGDFRIAETRHANEALEEVQQGILDGLSVGFRAVRAAFVNKVREVAEAELFEVSLTPLASYEGAAVLSLRSASPQITVPEPPQINLTPLPALWR